MACRRYISNVCLSNGIKKANSLSALATRCFSSDPKQEEISEKTHTGQV